MDSPLNYYMLSSLIASFIFASVHAAPAPQLDQVTALLGGAVPPQLSGLLGGAIPGAAPAAGAKKGAAAGPLGAIDLPIDIGAIGAPQNLVAPQTNAGGQKSSAPVASKNNFANASKAKTAPAPAPAT